SVERTQEQNMENSTRDTLNIYEKTLPAEHQNVGIGKAKLGRTLLRERRYEDALKETLAGYDILSKKADNSNPWLKNAKQDLSEEYIALKQPEQAARFRDEAAKH